MKSRYSYNYELCLSVSLTTLLFLTHVCQFLFIQLDSLLHHQQGLPAFGKAAIIALCSLHILK